MSTRSSNAAAQPVISFISIIILGIIISQYIVTSPNFKIPIIFFSIILAIVVAGFELRAMARSTTQNLQQNHKVSKEEAQLKLAKYVAELFDDDINFEVDDQDKIQDNSKINN